MHAASVGRRGQSTSKNVMTHVCSRELSTLEKGRGPCPEDRGGGCGLSEQRPININKEMDKFNFNRNTNSYKYLQDAIFQVISNMDWNFELEKDIYKKVAKTNNRKNEFVIKWNKLNVLQKNILHLILSHLRVILLLFYGLKNRCCGSSPGGSVGRVPGSHCCGPGPIPGQGTEILQVVQSGQEKKEQASWEGFYTSEWMR